jgi:transposase
VPARGKKLARHQLTADDVQRLVDQVVVHKWSYEDVALKLRVNRGLITRIMAAYKADPSLVEQLAQKEDRRDQQVALVQDSAEQLLARDGCIRKLSVVQQHIEESAGEELKPWFISKVLRRLLELKYSKVRKLPFKANFEDRLVLRHLYAKQALELLETDARLFSIDESWLNETSWNQRQWHQHGARNSVQSKSISPRLSLLVAIDNRGAIYASLTQVNTDHDVFQLFLTQLADVLTTEDPGWPASTYWLIDGAKYHKAEETLAKMRALGMRTLVMGPYGFLASPCEMVFAYLKQVDLNPDNQRTGKK